MKANHLFFDEKKKNRKDTSFYASVQGILAISFKKSLIFDCFLDLIFKF